MPSCAASVTGCRSKTIYGSLPPPARKGWQLDLSSHGTMCCHGRDLSSCGCVVWGAWLCLAPGPPLSAASKPATLGHSQAHGSMGRSLGQGRWAQTYFGACPNLVVASFATQVVQMRTCSMLCEQRSRCSSPAPQVQSPAGSSMVTYNSRFQ